MNTSPIITLQVIKGKCGLLAAKPIIMLQASRPLCLWQVVYSGGGGLVRVEVKQYIWHDRVKHLGGKFIIPLWTKSCHTEEMFPLVNKLVAACVTDYAGKISSCCSFTIKTFHWSKTSWFVLLKQDMQCLSVRLALSTAVTVLLLKYISLI